MSGEGESSRLEQEGWVGGCLLWFFWGVSLSFMTILSLVLLALLVASVGLNVYLGWQLAGLEVSVSRRDTGPIQALVPLPTGMLAAIPTQTPLPPSTPTPTPTESPLTMQLATLSAIATQVAAAPPGNAPPPAATPVVPATPLPPAVAIGTPAGETDESQPIAGADSQTGAATPVAVAPTVETPLAAAGGAQQSAVAEFTPPQTSSNSYSLIAIEGQRESRPPAEHGDLNLKLRQPEPGQLDPGLVEIPGSGIDPNAPNFAASLSPDQIVKTYAIHDWDWGCNCPGNLLPKEEAVLIGLKTTPGEPIFIPKTERDIFGGKYYATLLYADKDSLTFVYARAGSVVKGYTVHYVGLYTDPNLIALFEESKGSELPGLTLDTPVGVAGNELIMAIRDNGKFLDARSKKDWWE
ncbi:MAG: hypothetical protein AB1801_24265 [Chloroflexota bacterium]